MWFSISYFRFDPKDNPYSTCLLQTYDRLTDYQTKLKNEWPNELTSLQCPFYLSQRYFIKIPRLQCPNQGSHMMEFLLLSLKSGCMIAIRALTGMQLINHEEKMLRRQKHGVFCCGSKNSSKLLFSSNFLRGHVHVGIRCGILLRQAPLSWHCCWHLFVFYASCTSSQ